jgi:flavin prenyltransferase
MFVHQSSVLKLFRGMMRLVVAMTGATGAVLGIRLLERLREMPGVETHLVLSAWARSTIRWETGRAGT